MDQPPPPRHPPEPVELLDDEELEALTGALCEGDWKSAVVLEHHQAHQLTSFALARAFQWLVQLEQRTKT